MYSVQYRGDYEPIGYWGRFAIYITTIVLFCNIAGLFISILAEVTHATDLLRYLWFAPDLVFMDWQIWRPFTYWVANPPNFFVVFSLLFLFFYGSDVERFIGRRRTITFYLLMILLPPAILSLFWAFGSDSQAVMRDGSYYLAMGTLIAFATIYPGVEIYGIIKMKWLAWICVGFASIYPLSNRQYEVLLILLAECGAAFGYIRWLQNGAEFPKFSIPNPFRKKPKFRVLPDPKPAKKTREEQSLADVDLILDKISKKGLASLTAKEKALLEKGRDELIRREGTDS